MNYISSLTQSIKYISKKASKSLTYILPTSATVGLVLLCSSCATTHKNAMTPNLTERVEMMRSEYEPLKKEYDQLSIQADEIISRLEEIKPTLDNYEEALKKVKKGVIEGEKILQGESQNEN